MPAWLVGWLVGRLTHTLTGWLSDWMVNVLIGWRIDSLSGRLDLLTCRLTDWLTGWLAGWQVGWLQRCFSIIGCMVSSILRGMISHCCRVEAEGWASLSRLLGYQPVGIQRQVRPMERSTGAWFGGLLSLSVAKASVGTLPAGIGCWGEIGWRDRPPRQPASLAGRLAYLPRAPVTREASLTTSLKAISVRSAPGSGEPCSPFPTYLTTPTALHCLPLDRSGRRV